MAVAALMSSFAMNIRLPSRVTASCSGSEPAGNRPQQLQVLDADDADAVGTFIRRRQLALVNAGSGNRRSAERDIEHGTIWRKPDAAWPLPDWNRGDELSGADVDDAEIAAALVADEQLGTGGDFFGAGRRCRRAAGAAPEAVSVDEDWLLASGKQQADDASQQAFHNVRIVGRDPRPRSGPA